MDRCPDVASRAFKVAPEAEFALECMSATSLSLREGYLFPKCSGLVKSRRRKDGGARFFLYADCRNFAALESVAKSAPTLLLLLLLFHAAGCPMRAARQVRQAACRCLLVCGGCRWRSEFNGARARLDLI